MHNYQKIKSPFIRENANDKMVNMEKYSSPSVEYLAKNDWFWEEKIDGTSIGLRWDGERVSIVGHTDKSQIPPVLNKFLTEKYLTPEMETIFEQTFGDKPFTVYGEGISKEVNCHYGFPEGDFIMYDIQNDTTGRFWDRERMKEFAEKIDSETAPLLAVGDIGLAVKIVKEGMCSYINKEFPMEGLIGRPKVEFTDNKGDRLIVKVKVKDILGVKPFIKKYW